MAYVRRRGGGGRSFSTHRKCDYMDLYEMGSAEVHLCNGDKTKCLYVDPSSRATSWLEWDDSVKGGAVLKGLRKDMAAVGWKIVKVFNGPKRRSPKRPKIKDGE